MCVLGGVPAAPWSLDLRKDSSGTGCGAPIFYSPIQTYGHPQDIDGVWHCWREVRSRSIQLTSVTTGCMVEIIVSNGDTEGAFDLIHTMEQVLQRKS